MKKRRRERPETLVCFRDALGDGQSGGPDDAPEAEESIKAGSSLDI